MRFQALAVFAPMPFMITGCSALTRLGERGKDDLTVLQTCMVGSFSSAEQAAADKEYFDIRLNMVPIWTDRSDGPWLYVEQAAASALKKPYRQRIYRLRERSDGVLESAVYELPGDPLVFAGAWKQPAKLDGLIPSRLKERDGCTISLLREDDGSFKGSTSGATCLSNLRGATYATSQVTITSNTLLSWDRGFDKNGKQVWGAAKGPYVFRKDPPKKQSIAEALRSPRP